MTGSPESTNTSEKSEPQKNAEQAREKLSQEFARTSGNTSKKLDPLQDSANAAHLGTVELRNEDGSIIISTSNSNSKIAPSSDSEATSVKISPTPDRVQILADVEALHQATNSDYLFYRTADGDRINKILQCKTDGERKSISEQYKKKYGIELTDEVRKFEKGSDLDNFQNILDRQDTNIENQSARRIHEDLLEIHDWRGRDRTEIERDIRATLSTHTAEQISKMNDEYRNLYNTALPDAISKDSKISQISKEFADIFLHEQHNDQAIKQLVDLALHAKDVDCFQEAMRDASDAVRQDFLRTGGEKKMQDAFGQSDFGKVMDFALGGPIAGSMIYSHYNKTLERAADYANAGKLSAATQVKDNAGIIFDNKDGVELALKRMTDQERKQYFIGKELDRSHKTELSQEDATAKAVYTKLHEALTHVGNPAEVVKYEDMIANNGESSFVGSLAGHRGIFYNGSTSKIAQDINGITQKDWMDCKTHPERRKAFQEMLSTLNKSPEEVAGLLKQYDTVIGAKSFDQISPPKSISEQLDALPRKFISMGDSGIIQADTSETVALVQRACNADLGLRERLTHPQNSNEQVQADAFKKSLQDALGDDYELFGKPLALTGHLPLPLRMNLTRDGFGRDAQKALNIVAEATPEERQRLHSDTEFRREVLGPFNGETQKIALKVAEQGAVHPEDKIRSAIIGSGGSSMILNELKGLTSEQIKSVRESYCSGYGNSFDSDVMNKLSGNDRVMANRILTQNLSSETRANIAAVDTENARSGVGARLSDDIFRSGTGPQADDALNQSNRILAQKNSLEQAMRAANDLTSSMTTEQKQKALQDLQTYLTKAIDLQNQATQNHVDAKKKAGDYVGDVGIATAAIASMIATGGVDTPLVISLLAAGATIKVGTNSMMQGNNYDWSLQNVAKDGTIGAVMAATSVIGPAQLAALFNIGESAAKESAMLTMASLTRLGLQDTLAEGSQQVLETGAKKIMQNALASGATKIDAGALMKLAESAVAPEITGSARTQAAAVIAAQLRDNLGERMATGVVRYAAAQSLNAGGAGLGGGTSGLVNGALHWDGTQTVSKNLEHIAEKTASSAFTAALTGAAVSGASVAGKDVWQSIRSGVKPPVVARSKPPLAPPPVIKPVETPPSDAPPIAPPAQNLPTADNVPEIKAPSAETAKPPEDTPKSPAPPDESFEPEVRGRSIENVEGAAPVTATRVELDVPLLTDTEVASKLRQQINDVTQSWTKTETLTAAEFETRRVQLEEAINRFQDEAKLPRVKLSIDGNLTTAEGAYSDGIVRVSERDIVKSGETLNVVVGHELTHAEQDFLKICQAADRLGIGKVPTKAEATKLAEELKTLDDDYVNNNFALLPFAEDALAKRNGIHLTAAENARADLLEEAAKTYKKPDGRWTLIQDHLNRLQKGSAFDDVNDLNFYQSSTLSANLKKLLGTDTPPPEVQELMDVATAVKEGNLPKSAWDEHDAKSILSRVYRAELQKTQEEQARAFQEYQSNLKEKEAIASERNLREPRDPAKSWRNIFQMMDQVKSK